MKICTVVQKNLSNMNRMKELERNWNDSIHQILLTGAECTPGQMDRDPSGGGGEGGGDFSLKTARASMLDKSL